MNDAIQHRRAAATAWFLAGLGALPFAVMAFAQVLAPDFATAHLGGETAILSYGAVILSFMGGVRWGAALSPAALPVAGERMILSVAPSLAAWLALLIERPWSLLLLLAGFMLQGAWDLTSARKGDLPPWFGPLRLVISVIVAASILVVLLT